MTAGLEMVLFFVEDKEGELNSVVDSIEITNRHVNASDMLHLCVLSIKKRVPNARLKLITDTHTNIHHPDDGIEVIRDADINHDTLIYDRVRAYRDYLEKAVEEGRSDPILFLDIDLLFNRDPAEAFSVPFDVGFTVSFHPEANYSERGLPIGGTVTPINGGVMFARPTKAAAQFYRRWTELIQSLRETDDLKEYGEYKDGIRENFLKWWGAQHVLMVMMGKQLMAGKKQTIGYEDAQVQIFDPAIYNYSPEILDGPNGSKLLNITEADTRNCYVFHMKGKRKLFMPPLARKMGYE